MNLEQRIIRTALATSVVWLTTIPEVSRKDPASEFPSSFAFTIDALWRQMNCTEGPWRIWKGTGLPDNIPKVLPESIKFHLTSYLDQICSDYQQYDSSNQQVP